MVYLGGLSRFLVSGFFLTWCFAICIRVEESIDASSQSTLNAPG
jgi:hypothetical protein